MATTPPPGWGMVLATGVFALSITLLGLVPPGTLGGRVAASLHVLSTIVHEAGHAAMSIATGGGVYVIEIHSPHSGVAYVWFTSWFSSVATRVAGYAAPPLAGLGIAVLLGRGQAHTALILTIVVMVLVLLVSRDLVTVASVVAVGLVVFAAGYWGSAGVQQWTAYIEAWLLLLCETAGLWQLVKYRFDNDDAKALAQKTWIPRPIWILAWFALNGWALWIAAPLLWP